MIYILTALSFGKVSNKASLFTKINNHFLNYPLKTYLSVSNSSKNIVFRKNGDGPNV